jgi:mannose-1-phosphate guanylyltransferase
MDRPLVALVLAGGTGTRLYPASRSFRPKQFLELGGDRSLLARTIERVDFADETFVVAGEEHVPLVREHAPDAEVLVEPASKDTGPALAFATHEIRDRVGECVVLAVPSDHFIAGDFESTAREAARAALETEGFVTLGIEPTRPATGYGYIEPGPDHGGYFPVAQFREKPDRETAERFADDGFYWNSGLFAWTPSAFLDAARDSVLAPLLDAIDGGDPERGFAAVESVSVDYAVMERTDDAYVVPADFEWDDLGAWDALARVVEGDADGNVALADALTVDASGNVVAGEAHVSLVGVEGLVVAAFDDRVLVVPKAEAQRVREVVARLREEGLF